jgi:hypothetical protein
VRAPEAPYLKLAAFLPHDGPPVFCVALESDRAMLVAGLGPEQDTGCWSQEEMESDMHHFADINWLAVSPPSVVRAGGIGTGRCSAGRG